MIIWTSIHLASPRSGVYEREKTAFGFQKRSRRPLEGKEPSGERANYHDSVWIQDFKGLDAVGTIETPSWLKMHLLMPSVVPPGARVPELRGA